MRITLTLQSTYTGNTSIGPFTVSGTTNGGLLVNMTTGSISRTQLTSGWGYDDTTDTITGGTINSSGTCITGITWTTVAPEPTPPTPTSTVAPEPTPPTPTSTDVPSPTPTPFGSGARYNCDGINGGCYEAVDGDYDSLAACQAACPQTPN